MDSRNPDDEAAPRLLPCSDAATAYHLIYGRIDALLRGRAEVAELAVPACPDWTVGQTVAHLVGVAQDVVVANLDGVASPAWTQAQIERLGRHSIDELLDLWGESVDPVATQLAQATPELAAGQLIFDVLTHEHDIRGALGEPGSRTADLGYQVALGFLTTMYDLAFRGAGRVAMRLTTPSIGTVRLGDPDTATDQLAIELSDFDALRAFGGRRSVRQLSALPWHGDPPNRPPVAHNHAIQPPHDDLVE
ncbi:maleylpyruvate isomerase family mycothiol-dependent enzyme [Mycolicibacter icosiumassiliensis]|uniref:maleylpyruvate isomerase family mycothiol-dependent enzyme n=1 Tax=Mycolicibacter icosiumassiliensis TaxID=1792835 RepID=UPI00082C322F|nr:maleylpyruvate isomerase family mycothiol-dependent enzyme [Mycolicibacter icosiumassiliensis]